MTCMVYFSKGYGSQDNELTICYVELCALITKPKVSHSIPDAKPSSSNEKNWGLEDSYLSLAPAVWSWHIPESQFLHL